MEPLHDDPDAGPRRLAVLAGFGLIISTGFATVAAMALNGESREETALPDTVVTSTPGSERTPAGLASPDTTVTTSRTSEGGQPSGSAPATDESAAPGLSRTDHRDGSEDTGGEGGEEESPHEERPDPEPGETSPTETEEPEQSSSTTTPPETTTDPPSSSEPPSSSGSKPLPSDYSSQSTTS
ncbi:hypothetical protein [Actinopolyspora mortivallis]|uniref:Uncharacterized protein n=1 Tax=Actinopolyspora mortivallis TaxID=33906 RepID=A0A2T0GTS6_ACTMO|nr:hypothetical protein [Actinopolyspora mortivallis]PRW62525.1 hypothetical protein CEP50_14930 [Actinopolyspora mortivallis]